MANKKEHAEQELKKLLAKDIGGKNPIFSPGAIAEMQQVFYLYVDARQRRADVRDMIMTASGLGLDEGHEMAFKVLEEVYEDADGNPLDFETFLKAITDKIVVVWIGRVVPSARTDDGATSTCWTCRRRGSWTLGTCG